MLLCSQVEMKSVDPDVVETSTWCDCVCVSILPITVLRHMQSVGQVCKSKTKSESRKWTSRPSFYCWRWHRPAQAIAPSHLRASMDSIQLAGTRLMAACCSNSILGQTQYVEALRVIEKAHAAFINYAGKQASWTSDEFPHCKKLRRLVSCIITNTRVLSVDIEGVDQGYTDNFALRQIYFDFQGPKEAVSSSYERLSNLRDEYPAPEREEPFRIVVQCRIYRGYTPGLASEYSSHIILCTWSSHTSTVRHLLPIHTSMVGTNS